MPTLPEGPSVTARMLNGLDEFMATKGLVLADFAVRAGIDPALADDPDAFVGFDSVLGLFETAARASDDDAFGLHFAEFCPLCPIGLYHYVVSNAPSLREALKVRVRFSSLVVSAYRPSFEESDGVGTYIWIGPEQLGPRRQFLDYVVTLLVERVRIMLGDDSWMPLGVMFGHGEPKAIQEFKRVHGPRVQFGAERTCVLFDKVSLDRRLPTSEPGLFRELQAVAEKMPTAPVQDESLCDKVRRVLVASFARDGAAVAAVAQEVGLSVRSLQRSLAESGTTFEALRDDTRRKAAEQYLVDSDLPLTDIAFLLGFSELSAFSRVARGWFGEAASSFRRRMRARQPRPTPQ